METSAPVDTTPLYLMLKPDRSAEIATLGDERCLCVFTDERNIRPFYLSLYGGRFESRDVGTLLFEGPEKFRAFLRANQIGLEAQGVRHLAIDPAPDRDVARVPIRSFIAAGKPIE